MLEGQLMAINLCNAMLYDLSFVVVVIVVVIAFSEREPFLRGLLCGKCGKFLPQIIPHICHKHHKQCLCIFFLPGVNFFQIERKKLTLNCVKI